MIRAVADTPAPDLGAIKAKQQVVWSTGHYSRIGSMLQISGERLAEAMDARPGARFLDVAAGNGNLTLAAARRFCRVVSTDYVPSSLADGGDRAAANGFDVRFEKADAEALSYGDGTFDFVGSTFGVQFTPNQEKAAAELLRVCRRGGRIGLANWTPDGFVGRMFEVIGRFAPPAAGLHSPARWGTEAFLEEAFGGVKGDVRIRRRDFIFRFQSADHFLALFKDYYGPIIKAYEALPPERRGELDAALTDLVDGMNEATDGTVRIPGEYLEVVIEKAR